MGEMTFLLASPLVGAVVLALFGHRRFVSRCGGFFLSLFQLGDRLLVRFDLSAKLGELAGSVGSGHRRRRDRLRADGRCSCGCGCGRLGSYGLSSSHRHRGGPEQGPSQG